MGKFEKLALKMREEQSSWIVAVNMADQKICETTLPKPWICTILPRMYQKFFWFPKIILEVLYVELKYSILSQKYLYYHQL